MILHADVASNWLPCFPYSAKEHVYDAFFVSGLSTEVVQILVPCLQPNGNDGLDVSAVQSNSERFEKTFFSLHLMIVETDVIRL